MALSLIWAAVALACLTAGKECRADKLPASLAGHERGRYIVRNRFNTSKQGAVREVEDLGGRVLKDIDGPLNMIVVEFEDATPLPNRTEAARRHKAKADKLAQMRDVVHVEVDLLRYSNAMPGGGSCCVPPMVPDLSTILSTSQMTPYGITMVQADKVAYNASNPKRVCIIDSGIDILHPDLCGQLDNCAGRITTTSNFPAAGVDAFTDSFGHGTHIAGTIAALNNTFGVTGVVGNGLPLHVLKIFDSSGVAYSSDLINAAQTCQAAGASVISMSLGAATASLLEQQAFDLLLSQGVLLVASAGNDGPGALSYPASYDSVISVTAVDRDGVVWPGANTNNLINLAAPGVAVASTFPPACLLCGGAPGISTCNVTVGQQSLPCAVMHPAVTVPTPYHVTAPLVDCGLAAPGTTCAGAAGKICLIQRGVFFIQDKFTTCQASGGVGAILVNNASNTTVPFAGNAGFPAAGVDECSNATLYAALAAGTSVTVGLNMLPFPHGYGVQDGTSAAVPHVSAVAALVWSNVPTASALDVRRALFGSALDLGAPAVDPVYGFGLVQARAALAYLQNPPAVPGRGKVGDVCRVNLDCASSLCIAGLCSCTIGTVEGQFNASIGCAPNQACVAGPWNSLPVCASVPPATSCTSDTDCPQSTCDTVCDATGKTCVSTCRYIATPFPCKANSTCATGWCMRRGVAGGSTGPLAVLNVPYSRGLCCDVTSPRIPIGGDCPFFYGSVASCACYSGFCSFDPTKDTRTGTCACRPCLAGTTCRSSCPKPTVCVAGTDVPGSPPGTRLTPSYCGAPAPSGAYCLYDEGCASSNCTAGVCA